MDGDLRHGFPRVLVLEKKEADLSKSAPVTALSDEDEVSLHLQDTLTAGDGLCNPAAVKILLEEGPERIDELIAWGKHHGSKLVFRAWKARTAGTAACTRKGDSTGLEKSGERFACQGRVAEAHFDCAVRFLHEPADRRRTHHRS